MREQRTLLRVGAGAGARARARATFAFVLEALEALHEALERANSVGELAGFALILNTRAQLGGFALVVGSRTTGTTDASNVSGIGATALVFETGGAVEGVETGLYAGGHVADDVVPGLEVGGDGDGGQRQDGEGGETHDAGWGIYE